jgi:hypothetical protein
VDSRDICGELERTGGMVSSSANRWRHQQRSKLGDLFLIEATGLTGLQSCLGLSGSNRHPRLQGAIGEQHRAEEAGLLLGSRNHGLLIDAHLLVEIEVRDRIRPDMVIVYQQMPSFSTLVYHLVPSYPTVGQNAVPTWGPCDPQHLKRSGLPIPSMSHHALPT